MAWSCHYATGCFVAFLGDICTLKSGWNMKKLFCCPALELFHCLPLWKTVLFVSSRAFLLSTPTFLFSTPAEKSEATWKKATKCNKHFCLFYRVTQKDLNDFWKVSVASKWVKPHLQNFLSFLSKIMANFPENLVTIA